MSIAQILFILIFGVTFYLAWRQFGRIFQNIRMGRADTISGDIGWRIKQVTLVAFGQQKMFKRLIPAVFHFFIYAAFLLLS